MKLINPSWEIIKQKPGLEGIYEQIELAGRTCYKSTRKEGTTAKDFVDRMINSQHYAMLEHGAVYLKIPIYYPDEWDQNNKGKIFNKVANSPYSKIIRDSSNNFWYLSTNLRVIKENNAEFLLEYWCEPTEFHKKRVTVRFVTSNGIAREFTRHRVFSFAQESTRYCNYTNQAKFGNELTYIHNSDEINIEQKDVYERIERCYKNLIANGMKPQMARDILPLALKTELVMTGFVSDWEYLFRLRTSFIAETGKPHPDMSNLCDPLYKEFVKRGFIEK